MLLSIRSRQQSHRGTEEKASEQHHNHSKGKAPSQQVDCFSLSQNEEGTSWNEQGRLTDKEEAKIYHSVVKKVVVGCLPETWDRFQPRAWPDSMGLRKHADRPSSGHRSADGLLASMWKRACYTKRAEVIRLPGGVELWMKDNVIS
jgi:hypothetical protein